MLRTPELATETVLEFDASFIVINLMPGTVREPRVAVTAPPLESIRLVKISASNVTVPVAVSDVSILRVVLAVAASASSNNVSM